MKRPSNSQVSQVHWISGFLSLTNTFVYTSWKLGRPNNRKFVTEPLKFAFMFGLCYRILE